MGHSDPLVRVGGVGESNVVNQTLEDRQNDLVREDIDSGSRIIFPRDCQLLLVRDITSEPPPTGWYIPETAEDANHKYQRTVWNSMRTGCLP